MFTRVGKKYVFFFWIEQPPHFRAFSSFKELILDISYVFTFLHYVPYIVAVIILAETEKLAHMNVLNIHISRN